jgi:hypothetical protein
MSARPGPFDFAAQKERNVARWTDVGWDEVAVFMGPNAERFHGAWSQTRDKVLAGRGGMAFGFCWPAFLFGFAWFFYRRMWLAGQLLIVVPLALALLVDSPGASIGTTVAIALFAKSLYAQHAVAKVAAASERSVSEAEPAAAGGVSIPGAAIGGLILASGLAWSVYAVAQAWP